MLQRVARGGNSPPRPPDPYVLMSLACSCGALHSYNGPGNGYGPTMLQCYACFCHRPTSECSTYRLGPWLPNSINNHTPLHVARDEGDNLAVASITLSKILKHTTRRAQTNFSTTYLCHACLLAGSFGPCSAHESWPKKNITPLVQNGEPGKQNKGQAQCFAAFLRAPCPNATKFAQLQNLHNCIPPLFFDCIAKHGRASCLASPASP